MEVIRETTRFKVEQESVPFTDRSLADGRKYNDDWILIKLGASGAIRRWPDDSPITKHCWMDLPKMQRVGSLYRLQCTIYFKEFLFTTSIPVCEYAFYIDVLFRIIDAAVSADFPITLSIWERVPAVLQPVRIPAIREDILGLERVRVDTLEDGGAGGGACAICFADYQQLVTRLPCSHYYHEHCILQWLHINNTCPVCRFALPKVD